MGELGEQAERLHGYVGAYAAARVDLLVLVGGALAAQIGQAARTMGLSDDAVESFATVADAALALRARSWARATSSWSRHPGPLGSTSS